MPAVEMLPPDEGTYRFVLRRYDWSDRMPGRLDTYAESVDARSVEFQGRRASTVFISSIPARDRALKEGWIDETDAWFASLSQGATVSAPDDTPPARPQEPQATAPQTTQAVERVKVADPLTTKRKK